MKGENYINQLIEVKKETNWNQEKLAKELNVTFATLNRWINKHSKPQPSRIVQIQELHKKIIGLKPIPKHQINKILIEADKCSIPELKNHFQNNKNLVEDILLEYTYNSNAIEGSTLSIRDTESIIFNHQIISNKTLIEHLEASNHAAILKEILVGKYSGKITEKMIKHIHNKLFQGIREDAGEYSKYQRGIRGVNIVLTHPEDIQEEMTGFIDDCLNISSNQSFIENIANLHSSFELIHPFGDGNGRVGRLIMAIQLLKNNYPPVIIENKRKSEYYDALEFAQLKSDTHLTYFISEEIIETYNLIKKYI